MGRPLTIVFLVDALGWEVVERYRFCEELFEKRGPLDTILGYSSAAIPSLLSGTDPQQHGAWTMYRLAESNSPFGYLKHMPKLPHALEWRTRVLTRKLTDWRGIIPGYYDLYDIPLTLLGHFDVSLHGDPYVPGGLEVPTIFDELHRDGVAYQLWYYRTPESENMEALLAAIDGPSDVLFMYTAELDELMHRVGIFHERVEDKLRIYEEFLGRINEAVSKAGRDARVMVLSDHGMTNVSETVDLWGEITRRGYKLGSDYLAFYDATMARLWSDEAIRDVADAYLAETGAGRLLEIDELRRRGCDFDEAYGRWLFLVNPGVMIVPSFMGQEPLAAMHGYDPADPFSRGCFLTNDPAPAPGSIMEFKRYFGERMAEVV